MQLVNLLFHIIIFYYYRDGVSQSQFNQVLNIEVDQIMKVNL